MIISEIFNLLGRLRYSASPPTIADGQLGEMQGDASGNLKVSVQSGIVTASAPVPTGIARTPVMANSLVVLGAPTTLLELYGFNDDTVVKYLMLFNATSLPGNGASPIDVIRVAPGSFAFSPGAALSFPTGLTVGVSTSQNTLTIDSAGKTRITAAYK